MPFPEICLSIQNLCKTYNESGQERTLFKNLDMEIYRGELIVLLGRSGSGKTTLLNLISGIDRPSSGDLLINGINLSALPEHQRTLFRRRHIGFVFQSYNLIPTLTVMDNLLLPLELLKKIDRQDRARAAGLLAQLDLSDRCDTFPDRLSGGEQQRVAIARALIHEPALVLADEPTGNLDLDTGKQVLSVLDTLVRKAGRTLIMATHSREVVGLANRIFTIRNGSLVNVDGTP